MRKPVVISVSSGKGGVGKTHVALNLGVSLVNEGKKVLLVDADLSLANLHVLLGLEPQKNVGDLLQGADDVVITHETGIDILPATSGIAKLTSLSAEEQVRFMEAMQGLMIDYDYVLVDTAAGIGSNVLFFSSASDEILVVLNPESTSLADSYALIKVLSKEFRRRDFLVLVNKANSKEDASRTFKTLLKLCHSFLDVKLSYLGFITNDRSVSEALRKRSALVESFPSCKASLNFRSLATEIITVKPKMLNALSFSFQHRVENNHKI